VWVTNYNSAYTFTPSIAARSGVRVIAGEVFAGYAGAVLQLEVTGLAPGESAEVTVKTERPGYINGYATVRGSSSVTQSAALTPTFSHPVSTATGFTVNVTNYDSAYMFTPTTGMFGLNHGTVTAGAAIGRLLPLTVTGLGPGEHATVRVATTRSGYLSGSAQMHGQANFSEALDPEFSEPVATETGFTVWVTNWNFEYTFAATISNGEVIVGDPVRSWLPLTVTGLTRGESATVYVLTDRPRHDSGFATVTGAPFRGSTGDGPIPGIV
jgi:titin